MNSQEYLRITMVQLSNILHNVSQYEDKEKAINNTLDSIKVMLENYNRAGGKVDIWDFRKN